MTNLLVEIDNPRDVQLIRDLVERLGLRFKTLKNSTSFDKTEFLLDDPFNRQRLLQSAENVRNGTNLHEIDLNAFKEEYQL
jgi:hypothetical protein